MGKKLRTPLIYLAIVVLMIVLLTQLQNGGTDDKKIEYADFLAMAKEGTVEAVEYCNGEIVGIKKGSAYKDLFPKKYDFICNVSNESALRADMAAIVADAKGIDADKVTPEDYPFTYTYNPPPEPSILEYILPYLIMLIIIVVFYVVVFRAQGGGNKMMSFGKAHARTQMDPNNRVTFDDVAGADEEKEELKEVVEFMRAPKRFTEMGARIPKGVLLVGPPGTGKTLLAKAVAGEAKVPFFSISGSEFVEMFVGMGAAKVRDLFKQADEKAPCIVFIDEIDTIGKKRDSGFSSNDEREQTLNQLLTEMDGFDPQKGVVILAATNRPDTLDPALLRPGRFDRRIPVELPDLNGRIAILKVHSRDVKMSGDINFEVIARATSGASGAELANIINEAALRAVKLGRDTVIQEDLEESVEVVIAGYQRKGAVVSPEEKRIVAYHEIGHALVAAKQSNSAPVHKITIVPRTSGALGYTMQVEEGEKLLMTKEEAFNKIATLTGGRAAEAVIFGSITTGASNDIEQATRLARAMITRYGMSDDFGMVALETVNNQYLGGDTSLACSAETAAKIDRDVVAMIGDAYKKAEAIIKENRTAMDALAAYLLEKETITGEEFMDILGKQEQNA